MKSIKKIGLRYLSESFSVIVGPQIENASVLNCVCISLRFSTPIRYDTISQLHIKYHFFSRCFLLSFLHFTYATIKYTRTH